VPDEARAGSRELESAQDGDDLANAELMNLHAWTERAGVPGDLLERCPVRVVDPLLEGDVHDGDAGEGGGVSLRPVRAAPVQNLRRT
jgi:hypothetical protein